MMMEKNLLQRNKMVGNKVWSKPGKGYVVLHAYVLVTT